MGQTLLFPDPKPLDQRLGGKFFRRAPRRPGVYLMKDADDNVLYVGKAKDLKQRLGSYRLANPDRMPRRHLRMVREVAHIEFQFCANESAALRRESKLLRSLKPKYNRAGVWPGKSRFIVWRADAQKIELGIVETPEPAWRRFGPLNSIAVALHQSLSRLLWLALNPQASVIQLPIGWGRGGFGDRASFHCGGQVAKILNQLEKFFWGSSNEFFAWLVKQLGGRMHCFERAVVEADLERVREFAGHRTAQVQASGQLALL